MKIGFFGNKTNGERLTVNGQRFFPVLRLPFTVFLLWAGGGGLFAQNGVTISNFSVRAGTVTFTVRWTDASLLEPAAPDPLSCVPPALQTLQASAASYCEGGPGITLALDHTEPGAVYQLYKDGEPLSGATLTTAAGGAAAFSGTFREGTYTVQTLAGAFCAAAMAGTHVITAIAAPAVPVTFANDGPKCAGMPITFTGVVPEGATGLNWRGAVQGDGTSLTSGTAAGIYSARVRSFLRADDLTCYSAFAAGSSSTISACFDFVSAHTWPHPSLTWSDFVSSRNCKGEHSPGPAAAPWCRRYIHRDTLYFYNSPFVEQYGALMCPSPWSLPSAYAIHAAVASGRLPLMDVRTHLTPDGELMPQGCLHVAAGQAVLLRIDDDAHLQPGGEAPRGSGCRVLCVK
jgi:hypothetical protein